MFGSPAVLPPTVTDRQPTFSSGTINGEEIGALVAELLAKARLIVCEQSRVR